MPFFFGEGGLDCFLFKKTWQCRGWREGTGCREMCVCSAVHSHGYTRRGMAELIAGSYGRCRESPSGAQGDAQTRWKILTCLVFLKYLGRQSKV